MTEFIYLEHLEDSCEQSGLDLYLKEVISCPFPPCLMWEPGDKIMKRLGLKAIKIQKKIESKKLQQAKLKKIE